MLLELHIAGLGVIEDVTLEPAPGLSVLTGETGAGKTMVTVALSLALGRRARAGMVRPDAPRATIEARFDARRVPAAAEWAEDGEVILARVLRTDGRSTARAGGQLAPLSTLDALGEGLVEVHGQHQTQRLLRPSAQLGFLDRFAGREHVEVVDGYRAAHAALREARAGLDRLDREARDREREKDLLAYQVGEIEAAALREGEARDLGAEEARLAGAEAIRERLAAALAALSAEGGGADAVRVAAAAVAEAAEIDPRIGELAGRLGSLAEEIADAATGVRSSGDAIELDPARLEAVRDRIGAIKGLERKYGEGEEGVLAYLGEARDRLAALEGGDRERDRLDDAVGRLEAECGEIAAEMSAGRAAAAPRLAEALVRELEDLGMGGATIDVRLDAEPELGPDGAETAIFLFSGGPGQEAQPFGAVASGGELSRTMLACRTVLADLDDVPTIVFDEVDAGIGGRAGVAVGRRLARLARSRQVLVVTHLPQIACFADRHFRVTKDGGTAAVAALDDGGRVEELSRMLSGMPTDEAATHAEQLLAEAARERRRPAGRGTLDARR
ncbi:MAG TPA: DNA repair protein RecN [Actinomycetota bacterium]|nr:DNA repair protein RecN [Actinomycetota bacterium]